MTSVPLPQTWQLLAAESDFVLAESKPSGFHDYHTQCYSHSDTSRCCPQGDCRDTSAVCISKSHFLLKNHHKISNFLSWRDHLATLRTCTRAHGKTWQNPTLLRMKLMKRFEESYKSSTKLIHPDAKGSISMDFCHLSDLEISCFAAAHNNCWGCSLGCMWIIRLQLLVQTGKKTTRERGPKTHQPAQFVTVKASN